MEGLFRGRHFYYAFDFFRISTSIQVIYLILVSLVVCTSWEIGPFYLSATIYAYGVAYRVCTVAPSLTPNIGNLCLLTFFFFSLIGNLSSALIFFQRASTIWFYWFFFLYSFSSLKSIDCYSFNHILVESKYNPIALVALGYFAHYFKIFLKWRLRLLICDLSSFLV